MSYSKTYVAKMKPRQAFGQKKVSSCLYQTLDMGMSYGNEHFQSHVHTIQKCKDYKFIVILQAEVAVVRS